MTRATRRAALRRHNAPMRFLTSVLALLLCGAIHQAALANRTLLAADASMVADPVPAQLALDIA